jgi:hypothetical protein
MLARIPGRVDDDVVLGGIQFAKRLLGQLAVPDRRSALQGDVTEIVDFIIERHLSILFTSVWYQTIPELGRKPAAAFESAKPWRDAWPPLLQKLGL